MKYAIDKIEDNVVVIEDIDGGIKKEIDIHLLPKDIYEGMIVVYDNNKYIKDMDEELKRRREILEKFMRLRNKQD